MSTTNNKEITLKILNEQLDAVLRNQMNHKVFDWPLFEINVLKVIKSFCPTNKFFRFWQNNVGRFTMLDELLAECMFIEAYSEEEAKTIAENFGMEFDD